MKNAKIFFCVLQLFRENKEEKLLEKPGRISAFLPPSMWWMDLLLFDSLCAM